VRFEKVKFYIHLNTFIIAGIVGLCTYIHAQPQKISVFVNGDPFPVNTTWVDSAQRQFESMTIRYNITGAHSYGSEVTTMIRLPQVLTAPEVIEQVLLYYFMLDEETAKNSEQLFIYPYFTDQNQRPPIRASYQSGTLNVNIKEWKTVQRPKLPTPEEREIYNQIVENFFTEVQEYNSMSSDQFNKIAKKNNISVERVQKIYEDVILWNLTR
jgi:hypothetical protein